MANENSVYTATPFFTNNYFINPVNPPPTPGPSINHPVVAAPQSVRNLFDSLGVFQQVNHG